MWPGAPAATPPRGCGCARCSGSRAVLAPSFVSVEGDFLLLAALYRRVSYTVIPAVLPGESGACHAANELAVQGLRLGVSDRCQGVALAPPVFPMLDAISHVRASRVPSQINKGAIRRGRDTLPCLAGMDRRR